MENSKYIRILVEMAMNPRNSDLSYSLQAILTGTKVMEREQRTAVIQAILHKMGGQSLSKRDALILSAIEEEYR